MERDRNVVNHEVLGQYIQRVFDNLEEAGYTRLASEDKYGWQMPQDAATEYILSQCAGKQIMDLGCGYGETVTIPTLRMGATHVFAIDVIKKHVDNTSLLANFAKEHSIEDKLTRILVSEKWWYSPLSTKGLVEGFFDLPDQELNIKSRLDIVIARHSMQFGNPYTVIQALDLASFALKRGGNLCGINFTPYTEYVFQYDDGLIMQQIVELNEAYMCGVADLPGGYLHEEHGLLHVTFKQLIKRTDIATDTFIYLDEPTMVGLLRDWGKTREARGLEVDLRLVEGFYFTPDNITTFNKLVSGDAVYHNRENYLFVIQKQ